MAAEDSKSKADAIDKMPIGIEGLVELDLSIFPMLGDEARGPTALDADKTEWKRLYWILQWRRGFAEQG